MALTNRDYVMTAMMKRTAKALASSMRRIRETTELLDASQSFMDHRHPLIGAQTWGLQRIPIALDPMTEDVDELESRQSRERRSQG